MKILIFKDDDNMDNIHVYIGDCKSTREAYFPVATKLQLREIFRSYKRSSQGRKLWIPSTLKRIIP